MRIRVPCPRSSPNPESCSSLRPCTAGVSPSPPHPPGLWGGFGGLLAPDKAGEVPAPRSREGRCPQCLFLGWLSRREGGEAAGGSLVVTIRGHGVTQRLRLKKHQQRGGWGLPGGAACAPVSREHGARSWCGQGPGSALGSLLVSSSSCGILGERWRGHAERVMCPRVICPPRGLRCPLRPGVAAAILRARGSAEHGGPASMGAGVGLGAAVPVLLGPCAPRPGPAGVCGRLPAPPSPLPCRNLAAGGLEATSHEAASSPSTCRR